MAKEKDETKTIIVTGVHVYPIKSCAGVSLTSCRLTATGLEGDRSWMVVSSTGRFMSQRNCPEMARIRPQIVRSGWGDITGVRLLGDGFDRVLECPIQRTNTVRVSIWDAKVNDAFDQGDAAAEWLSSFLDRKGLRLVYVGNARRPVADNEMFAVAPGVDAVSFSDGYPILVISEESLEDLNRRLGTHAVPMNRFRPNIVVKGGGAFCEDRWKRFQINSTRYFGVKRCDRCQIPTTNQLTAEQQGFKGEPLKTLRTYRSGTVKKKGVFFGQNVIHEHRSWLAEAILPSRHVAIGNEVRVLETGVVPETSKPP